MSKLFPNLTNLSFSEGILVLIAIIAIAVIVKQTTKSKEVPQDIKKIVAELETLNTARRNESGSIAQSVLRGLDNQREQRLDEMERKIRKQQANRRKEDWVLVAVKLYIKDEDTAYAPVLLNTKTGAVKAAPEENRFFSLTSHLPYWRKSCLGEMIPRSALGAPKWKRVDNNHLIICGKQYHHFHGNRSCRENSCSKS